MYTYNKIILMGNITDMPEIKPTKHGKKMAKLGIAVHGQRDEVDFFQLMIFKEKLVEFVGECICTGTLLIAEGQIKNYSWVDTNGKKIKSTSIIIDVINVLKFGEKDIHKKTQSETNNNKITQLELFNDDNVGKQSIDNLNDIPF